MGKRRVAQVSSEDEEPSPPADDRRRRKQRRLRHVEYDDDADKEKNRPQRNGSGARGGVTEDESEEEGDEDEEGKAEPVGDVLKVTGKGKKKKNHYGSFEFEGNVFELEDSVLLTPEDSKQKPYVAIIKDITEDVDGNFMVTGQWFYRPEEAEKKGGGNWQARDTRELFYSFHRDDVPAESVMHKCAVHFVPFNKKLPIRSQHPGFIVQKVYDTVERKLWKLTDKGYEDGKQHEIDLLVQKTKELLGELPDLEPEEPSSDQHDQANQTALTSQMTSKWNLRRKPVPSIDAQRVQGIIDDWPIDPSQFSEKISAVLEKLVDGARHAHQQWVREWGRSMKICKEREELRAELVETQMTVLDRDAQICDLTKERDADRAELVELRHSARQLAEEELHSRETILELSKEVDLLREQGAQFQKTQGEAAAKQAAERAELEHRLVRREEDLARLEREIGELRANQNPQAVAAGLPTEELVAILQGRPEYQQKILEVAEAGFAFALYIVEERRLAPPESLAELEFDACMEKFLTRDQADPPQ